MKKYIIPGSILIFIAAVVVVVKAIDIGRLTVSLIERSVHVDISYERMQGNVFRGFRFYDYKVKLSETDSIVGDFAEINYRFSSIRFGLPNLFEINLLEPRVNIRPKPAADSPAGRPAFKLPILNLGLRINLKNGEFAYEAKKVYEIRKISGLVFLDFVGSRLHISTMNLSCASPEWPVSITTANTSVIISDRSLTLKSFFARGNGFLVDGSGEYRFSEDSWSLSLRRADLNLKTLGLYQGRIEGKGTVTYTRGRIQPRIQGQGTGIGPFDRFQFESNMFGDTVLVNVFNGVISGGDFSLEGKFVDYREPILVASFDRVDLAPFLNLKTPVRVNGRVRYGLGDFSTFLDLSVADRPNVDSIYAFGQASIDRLSLDSLFIQAGEKILTVRGKVTPECSLEVTFNNLDLEKYVPELPVKGRLSGDGGLRGSWKKLEDLTVDLRLNIPEASVFGIQGRDVVCDVRDFNYAEGEGFLKLRAADLSYNKHRLDSLSVQVQAHRFDIRCHRRSDSLKVEGDINQDLTGTIERLVLVINRAACRTTRPTTFDLPKRRLGDFSLELLGGIAKGAFQPMRLELRGIHLDEIGRFLRYQDTLRGEFDADYDGRLIRLDARRVDFMGLKRGVISISGQIRDRGIALDSLTIQDARGQSLRAEGYLSFKESDIKLKVSKFGVWPMFFLKSLMDQPRGIVNGEARFKGNFENINLVGDARVDDFSFGIKVITARFDSAQGNIKFNGDRIQFQDIKGRMYSAGYNKPGPGAEIGGGGTVKLEPRFKVRNLSFDFNFKDASIQYLPFVYGRGTGNFSINVKNEITYYSGNVSVKEGVVPIDFGTKLPSAEPNKKADDRWRMNLKISADRNVWLRNREADIEFGGDLYIIKEQGPLYLAGNLQTRRGDFYWFSHTLKVAEGQITFIPEEVIDPRLDFTAELNTHERSRKAENKEIVITLRASGTLSEPIFEFFSDPPDYSEQDILTYLNLNISWADIESIKQGQYVGEVLPKSLLAWLESDVSRRIRKYTGMDVIQIEAPFFEAGQKTKLTVGKYISRNLFITYTYDFTTFSNQFNVEYFINDKNEIMVKKEEAGDYSLEYQYRIRF